MKKSFSLVMGMFFAVGALLIYFAHAEENSLSPWKKWSACENTPECVIIEGICAKGHAANKKFETEAQQWVKDFDARAECRGKTEDASLTPVAVCENQMCQIKMVKK